MSDKGLLEIAHRLIVDQDFRARFLIAPEDVLADLGVSAKAYQTLVAMAPVLLAGGVVLLKGITGGGGGVIEGEDMSWGRSG